MKGAKAHPTAHFGQGSGPIHLDNVNCTGSETFLLLCSSDPIGSHNCDHYEDAGVACAGTYTLTNKCMQQHVKDNSSSDIYQHLFLTFRVYKWSAATSWGQ